MTSSERIDALEERIVQLEHTVQHLLRDRGRRVTSASEPVLPPAAPAPPRPAMVTPEPVPGSTPVPPRIAWEEWLGQRGFLAIGVMATLTAVGYFLLLAFQRGWISPEVRSLGGAVVGLGLAVFGWRLYQRGLFRYGAALIGAGIGINYLTAWAATRLYGFIPTAGGAVTLAGLSLLLAAVALLLDVQWLATAGALGGLMAPILLDVGQGSGNLYLAYLGTMVLVLGSAAVARRWRITARLLVVFAAFLQQPGLGAGAGVPGFATYGAAVGFTGVLAGMRLRWGEIRLGGFLAGWIALLFGMASNRPAPVMLVGAGLLLALPAWLVGLRGEVVPRSLPGEASEPDQEATPGWLSPALREGFYFYLTALLLSLVLASPLATVVHPGMGYALLLCGAAYLMVGLLVSRPAFELAGTLGVGFGSVAVVSPVVGCWLLVLLALAWAGSDHLLKRTQGRWLALLPLAGAIYFLGGFVLPTAPSGDPAFVGRVSSAVWGVIATSAVLAAGLWRRADPVVRFRRGTVPQCLWGVTGLLLLVGMTREIHWYFANADLAERTRSLAGGLAVSAWWALFAGTLVLIGFRLAARPVRLAGLAVAVLAAAKVVVIDLSTLDALYRVASVLILAGVFLGVSYLYNRSSSAMLRASGTLPS